ncbi:DUF4190 domain-containing protein [Snodgrassella sp. CFCC 13594]|uniref:DUF4190 domain-containing protein n=1 Tax=Snodgrassella sp. CFCC 13594 TaxID=1775559 RepID=UPI00082A5046|nr:DUF4190 domain-containing protein [Snodgrassella sp. CFCC 13594]
MGKLVLPKTAAVTSNQNSQPKSNTPALLSLIFGILGFLVLPLIGSLLAIITGHMGRAKAKKGAGRGGLALAGLLLGYLALILTLFLGYWSISYYQQYTALAKQHMATQKTDNDEDSVYSDVGSDAALKMATLWVETRVAKGTNLNEVTEPLTLNPEEQKYWQKIDIRQGSIYAYPRSGSSEPLLLMSVQAGKKMQWACAGKIPREANDYCASL